VRRRNRGISDEQLEEMVEESEYLNWLISGCNIIDLKRLLDSFGYLDKK